MGLYLSHSPLSRLLLNPSPQNGALNHQSGREQCILKLSDSCYNYFLSILYMPGAMMGAEDTKMSSPLSRGSYQTSKDRWKCTGHYSVEVAEMGRGIM